MYKHVTEAPLPTTAAGYTKPIAVGAVDLPCDVHLVNFRSLEANNQEQLVLLHRKGYVCDFEPYQELHCSETHGQVDVQQLFSKTMRPKQIEECSLTLMQKETVSSPSGSFMAKMNPMEVHAWKMS